MCLPRETRKKVGDGDNNINIISIGRRGGGRSENYVKYFVIFLYSHIFFILSFCSGSCGFRGRDSRYDKDLALNHKMEKAKARSIT